MKKQFTRTNMRIKRHRRVRNKIVGTREVPRLCLFKSNKYIYCQIIDDSSHNTLVSASSLKLTNLKNKANIAAAAAVGEAVAKSAVAKKITKVVFDRGGYIYHGKIRAFAESARANGLVF